MSGTGLPDGVHSDFGLMGESIPKSLVNMSRGSRYTTTVPKQTGGRGASPTGKKVNKGATQIQEANGPACTIKATLYAPNAAEAGLVERNVKIMPTSVGSRDFWTERQRSQTDAY